MKPYNVTSRHFLLVPKKPPKRSGAVGINLPCILQKSPEKSDVYNLLKKKSAHWDDFARELNIDDNFRQDLSYEGNTIPSRSKLERVLKKWIESETSEVTWRNIIRVLEDLEFTDLARDVDDYLRKEEVVKKYIERNNYKSK